MWICKLFGHIFRPAPVTMGTIIGGGHLYCPRCGKILPIKTESKEKENGLQNTITDGTISSNA